jgi:hypothetical protein
MEKILFQGAVPNDRAVVQANRRFRLKLIWPGRVTIGMGHQKDHSMSFPTKETRGHLVPVALAAIIAVVGTVTLFFMAFGPTNNVQSNGISMITTAVVDRAGATVTEAAH